MSSLITKKRVSFRPVADPELARAMDNLRFRPCTKDELGKFLQVSERTIDTWIAKRKVPFIRISPRMIRFNLGDVERALTRYTVKEVSL